ncbi:hypothetical protein N0V88_004826 [Collariella sp. IMI 366227]|nr:hypothetical protein N0V88_004826 [Collariella sp. IMI 366227]
MPVKQITTELGHSLPPEAPHNITFHIPGWATAKALRRGDPELMSKLSSIYPRFKPWCEVRQVPLTHALSPFRTPPTASPSDLLFRAVDIPSPSPPSEPDGDIYGNGEVVRLYIVAYPADLGPGVVGVWQNFGADKYDIPVVVDDTIGSFCNIDVSPVADVILTSITKSLSGYANDTLTTQFINEYFHPDAATLLTNSQSYLARSTILNRNALTLATYLHAHSQQSQTTPHSP